MSDVKNHELIDIYVNTDFQSYPHLLDNHLSLQDLGIREAAKGTFLEKKDGGCWFASLANTTSAVTGMPGVEAFGRIASIFEKYAALNPKNNKQLFTSPERRFLTRKIDGHTFLDTETSGVCSSWFSEKNATRTIEVLNKVFQKEKLGIKLSQYDLLGFLQQASYLQDYILGKSDLLNYKMEYMNPKLVEIMRGLTQARACLMFAVKVTELDKEDGHSVSIAGLLESDQGINLIALDDPGLANREYALIDEFIDFLNGKRIPLANDNQRIIGHLEIYPHSKPLLVIPDFSY